MLFDQKSSVHSVPCPAEGDNDKWQTDIKAERLNRPGQIYLTSSKLYRSYDPHRSRDSMSPVCGIFFSLIHACASKGEGYRLKVFFYYRNERGDGRDQTKGYVNIYNTLTLKLPGGGGGQMVLPLGILAYGSQMRKKCVIGNACKFSL